MDVQEFWQENKRFVIGVGAGVVLFVVGSLIVDALYKSDLVQVRKNVVSTSSKLRNEAMYGTTELERAKAENQALAQCVQTLSGAVAFETRPRFRFDPARGSASNQYFAAVSESREELLTLAGRASLRAPDDLGLPALSPTREADIVRHLEALDLIDRALRLAIAAGVSRVERVEIKLDPKLASPKESGGIELTRVQIALAGRPAPLVRFLASTQDPNELEARVGSARTLLIEKVDMQPARSKAEEALLEITLLVARGIDA